MATIKGTAGNDVLYGTGKADKIFGLGGNDRLDGAHGVDVLHGGPGNDRLVSQGVNGFFQGDVLYGDAGDDVLNVGDGRAYLVGGAGNDTFQGRNDPNSSVNYPDEAGPIRIDATAGTVTAASGTDTLVDVVVVQGTRFDDVVTRGVQPGRGEYDYFTFHGGDGNDRYVGGPGNDYLSGEKGNDVLIGSPGGDGASGSLGNDQLAGGLGDDILRGDEGADRLSGGDGTDELSGGLGNDMLFGGAGADQLRGDEGTDGLNGGEGADTFFYEIGFGSGRGEGGRDRVLDFARGEDLLDLRFEATYQEFRGVFEDFDSDGSGVLDRRDEFVEVTGSGAGRSTVIDVGEFAESIGFFAVEPPPGSYTVTVAGTVGLTESDFADSIF